MTTDEFSYNLTGYVRHQGLPVAGVDVSLFRAFQSAGMNDADIELLNGQSLENEKTSGKGEFSFLLKKGKYRLKIAPNPSTRFLGQTSPEISLSANSSLDLNLNTGVLLAGKVLTENKQAVTTGIIAAFAIEPVAYLASAEISADGNYSLVVPKGKYFLVYCPNDNSPYLTREKTILAISQDTNFDIVLPKLIHFAGEIKNSDGQPISKAIVKVVPYRNLDQEGISKLDLPAQQMSNKEGKVEFYLEPGIYNIAVEPEKADIYFGLKRNELEINQDHCEKFVLAEGFRISGQVAYANQPLSNCSVSISSCRDGRQFFAHTDTSGEFAVTLPGGNYQFVVSAQNSSSKNVDGLEYRNIAPLMSMVVVSGDWRLSFSLQEGISLSGSVVDELGNPRRGIPISVYLDGDLPENGSKIDNLKAPLSSDTTDSAGNYRFFLSPGTYWLVAQEDFAHTKKIDVANEVIKFDLTCSGWRQVVFEMAGMGDEKIGNCLVRCQPYMISGQVNPDESAENILIYRRAFSDDQGFCYLNLPQGIYTFEFVPPAQGSYENKIIRQLSVHTDLSRKIALSSKP